jgi:hypothetical protein
VQGIPCMLIKQHLVFMLAYVSILNKIYEVLRVLPHSSSTMEAVVNVLGWWRSLIFFLQLIWELNEIGDSRLEILELVEDFWVGSLLACYLIYWQLWRRFLALLMVPHIHSRAERHVHGISKRVNLGHYWGWLVFGVWMLSNRHWYIVISWCFPCLYRCLPKHLDLGKHCINAIMTVMAFNQKLRPSVMRG